MPSPITLYPEPRAGDFFRPAGPMRPWLKECAGLYQWGRSALYWAFRGMALTPGTRAWIPAYHCGVEIDAATEAGLSVDFYRVKPDLTIDLDDLERKLRARPGPVLAIHYFGFVQPRIEQIAEICRLHHVILVEDCAHALCARIGGRAAGSFAPVSAFSLYKSLPTLEGGALRIDQSLFYDWVGRRFMEPEPTRRKAPTYRLFLKSAARRAAGQGFTRMYRRLRFGPGPFETDTADPVYHPEPCDYTNGLGAPARFIAERFDADAVAARRRENYRLLAGRLAKIPSVKPVFSELPEGACPLVFPVRVGGRHALMEKLAGASIETYVFGAWRHPAIAVERFPETASLRHDILGLPVHQNLSPADIDRMASAIQALSGR